MNPKLEAAVRDKHYSKEQPSSDWYRLSEKQSATYSHSYERYVSPVFDDLEIACLVLSFIRRLNKPPSAFIFYRYLEGCVPCLGETR
jgi:hypothetical protein